MNKHVPLDEKLAVLRESDTHRKWSSLDDERLCIVCGRLITGRMIDIWQATDGAYRLHCPTSDCASAPRDWFDHGAHRAPRPVLARSRGPILGFGFRSRAGGHV